jgi:WD40 repeat protein
VITALAFDSNEKPLFATSQDNVAWVWGSQGSDEAIRLILDVPLSRLAFSPDGAHLAALGQGGRIGIWESANGKPIDSQFQSGPEGVEAIALSNGSTRLALAGGSLGNRLEVYRPHQTEALLQLEHRGVAVLAFSWDGGRLASSGLDGTVRVWDLEEGEEEADLEIPSGASSLAFSQAGDLAAGGSDGLVRIWDLRLQALLDASCSRLLRNLTLKQWCQFLPDQSVSLTCPDLGLHESFIQEGYKERQMVACGR